MPHPIISRLKMQTVKIATQTQKNEHNYHQTFNSQPDDHDTSHEAYFHTRQ